MASKQQVAIPEKHRNKIRELKAALAADKTCMVEPIRDMAKPLRNMAKPLGAFIEPMPQTHGWDGASMICHPLGAFIEPMPQTHGWYGASMICPPEPPVQARRKEEKEKQSTVTRSVIANLTDDKVAVHATKNWSGRAIGGYKAIEKGKLHEFHHKGTKDDSKGAVVYAGKVENKDVAFLLAWHAGCYADSENKLYVECGSLDDYKTIKWEEIEKKLDGTTESNGHSRHEKTGAALSADIDCTGINPRLACIFDVMN